MLYLPWRLASLRSCLADVARFAGPRTLHRGQKVTLLALRTRAKDGRQQDDPSSPTPRFIASRRRRATVEEMGSWQVAEP